MVSVLVFLVVKVRTHELPLSAELEPNHPRNVVELAIGDWDSGLHRYTLCLRRKDTPGLVGVSSSASNDDCDVGNDGLRIRSSDELPDERI